MKHTAIKWLKKPQKHDYPSALSYLSLLMAPRMAKKLVAKLKSSEMATFHAKDIFRASRLPLLGANNSHVEKVRNCIMKGEAISPLLLCRGSEGDNLVIADGYHRLCAVYTFDEDAMIPAKIV
jgi:disulfide oxidoreductase YuzD